MNAITHPMPAPRKRGCILFKTLAAAAAAVWLAGCAGPGPAPALESAPKGRTPAQSSAADYARSFRERPGLATQWGDSVKDPVTHVGFARASSKPYGMGTIYYNDRDGLRAMGVDNYRVESWQQAAGGVVEWGVRGGFGMLPAYLGGDGRIYVAGKMGGSYSLVVKNRCRSRLLVVLSVDGLDVLDGKPAGVNKPGYVIDPGQTLSVKGFRTAHDAVAAFRFSTVSGSYAQSRHGDTRNVGVIGLAVFLEKGVDPWTWMPGEIQRREGANPFATAR